MNRSLTFMAYWLGQIVVPAKPIASLPKRFRVGSFSSDGTARLYDADGIIATPYDCTADQLADALRYGVLLPEGTATDGQSIGQLARSLKRMCL